MGLGPWCPLPEGDGRYPAHEGVGGDALQVEQDPVEEQQQDDVLAEAKASPTLANDGDVLEVADRQTQRVVVHQPTHPVALADYGLMPCISAATVILLHAKVHCNSQFYLSHSKVQESKYRPNMNSEAPLVASCSTNGPSTCLESAPQGQLESEKGWGSSQLTRIASAPFVTSQRPFYKWAQTLGKAEKDGLHWRYRKRCDC